MYVGYLRNNKKPRHFSQILAIVCKYRGIELLYIEPEDVEINSKKIKGRVFSEGKWIEKEVELPRFIDVAPTLFTFKKYKKVLNYLKENTTLSIDKRMPLPKDKLEDFFNNDPEISKYIIPSINIDNINDIYNFLDKHKEIVLKPIRSNKGRNVFLLSRKGSDFVLKINKEEQVITKSDFESFYTEKIKGVKFIAQKYILSVDQEGNPIDCRIHMEKGENGNWVNVDNFVRIGIGQQVISNINQGGGTISAKKFLKIYYDDNWKKVYQEIKNITKKLPVKIEKLLGREYMNFGFDIGMTPDGQLYLFEVNDHPIVTISTSKIAIHRTGYYKFMLEKK